ncbi:MAG TPA: nucleotidyltransferase domain-containing protein [Chloroflexia bacterium]|nr:nucleotidyltransferase domain-containing protein [Chloroflexia bacterium]
MRNPFLSTGTRVVTTLEAPELNGHGSIPAGSVGVVAESPQDNSEPYLVRFAPGREARYLRSQLEINTHFQEAPDLESSGEAAGSDLYRFVIYRCVIGSRAYGLEQPGSDTDYRGFFLPPAERHWSLRGVPEQLENEPSQEVYWEIQKFLTLALKANPNILECLYSPLVEKAEPLALELLAMKEIFLSKLIYQTYNGYVLSQFKKIEQDLRTRGQVRWKHAMHLVRLLLAGITALEEGFIPVNVGEHSAELLAIRNGQVSWPELDARRLELHRRFEKAFTTTRLPERPDYDRADLFLITARRAALNLN